MIYALLCLMFNILWPADMHSSIASVMTELQNRAMESGSDVVIVARDGKIIFQYQPNPHLEAIDSQEMAKSLIGLAYAFLMQDGKIPCLNIPVRNYYPNSHEWKAQWKADMTLSDLFSQTSGLTSEACISSNWEDAPIESNWPPKCIYSENDNNWRLLHRLVKNIAGQPFEDYMLKKLFIPLGIHDVSWNLNSFDTALRVCLLPQDWMKIGHFLLGKGCFGETKLLSDQHWQAILSASQRFNPFEGLGWKLAYYNLAAWWDELLIDQYRLAGMQPSQVCALTSLQGRELHFTGQLCHFGPLKLQPTSCEPAFSHEGLIESLIETVQTKGLPLCRFKAGKLKAYYAYGKGGQQLYIYPQGRMVAIRQKRIRHTSDSCTDTFAEFPCLLESLAAEYEGWVD